MIMKYITLVTWPIFSNGGSTGFLPIQVRVTKIVTVTQNFIFDFGLNFVIFFFLVRGMVNKIRIDIRSATTPPSFDGIDRRIA